MSVIGGLIVLVVVLAAASAVGFRLRARSGRFQAPRINPNLGSNGPGRLPAGSQPWHRADGRRPGRVARPAGDPGPVLDRLLHLLRPDQGTPGRGGGGRGPASRSWRSTRPTGWTWPGGCGSCPRRPCWCSARMASSSAARPASSVGSDLLAAVGAVLGEDGELLSFPPNKATISSVSAGPSWSARRRVTAASRLHSIWSVTSGLAQMLTKRRAVDFCRVTTAMCTRAVPATA